MIKLERRRTTQVIPVGLRGAKRVEKNLLLLKGKRDGTLQFNSTYWKSAKSQLKAESNGKCAYCEAPTETVAHGDVEHFRPKGVYWWLAYCYDNYLFACQICNQAFKLDNFPVHSKALQPNPPLPDPIPGDLLAEKLQEIATKLSPDPLDEAELVKFTQVAAKEKPGLVNPYLTDPEPFFKWAADPVLKEVRLKPRNNKVAAKRAVAAAEQFLGLNREELVRIRWQTFEVLATFKEVLESGQLGEALRQKVKNQLREMMANSSPFAGMVRYFVKDEWQLEVS